MIQYHPDDQMPNFSVLTGAGQTTLLSLVSRKRRTALVLLRYAGCRICQYDMLQISHAYENILISGGQVLIVLQSSLSSIQSLQAKQQYPFTIISDERGVLYRALGVESALSAEELSSPAGQDKLKQAVACGIVHGAYEGNELQLPAAFVLTPNLKILFAHYGSNAADTPSPLELAALMRA
ncbi:redoxin domain-containing protein [uncultured Oscillibacter sp.]|uniref:redoxin domain-containing protein n=1 Tax=uncultured Oscillibacter sp. TaxID=876091 RepID=UPI0025F12E34|nr:redoxin domain-containing protein [uncultured Oscillibacter sp.]